MLFADEAKKANRNSKRDHNSSFSILNFQLSTFNFQFPIFLPKGCLYFMPTVKEILSAINAFAPFASQCEWDNSGLLIGDAAKNVRRVGLALDLTRQTLNAAIEENVDLLVTHHPVIFRGVRALLAEDPLYELVRRGIAVISVHTPWDCANGGVNDVLCGLFSLSDIRTAETPDTPVPMLRLGKLEREMTPREFARFAAETLKTTVRLASCGKPVKTVAVCGGAAMELCESARLAGADVFLTGDAKHHELLDAAESVVAAGHFETERPAMAAFKEKLQAAFPALCCVLLPESNPVEFFGGR